MCVVVFKTKRFKSLKVPKSTLSSLSLPPSFSPPFSFSPIRPTTLSAQQPLPFLFSFSSQFHPYQPIHPVSPPLSSPSFNFFPFSSGPFSFRRPSHLFWPNLPRLTSPSPSLPLTDRWGPPVRRFPTSSRPALPHGHRSSPAIPVSSPRPHRFPSPPRARHSMRAGAPTRRLPTELRKP
jgi:hypothetical protein